MSDTYTEIIYSETPTLHFYVQVGEQWILYEENSSFTYLFVYLVLAYYLTSIVTRL